MCEWCDSNSKRSIAGKSVREYRKRHQDQEQWRLYVCTDLQATLIFNMCNAGVTPNSDLSPEKDLGKDLWSYSTLDVRYDYNFKKVLRKKYLDRAKSLVREIVKFGAFNTRQNGGSTVYLWDTHIVNNHFDSVRSVKVWLQFSRAQARAQHEHQQLPLDDVAAPLTPRRRNRPSAFTTPQTSRTGFFPTTPTSASSTIEQTMNELHIGNRAMNAVMRGMGIQSSPTFSRTGMAGLSLDDPSPTPSTPRTPLSPRYTTAPLSLNFNSISSPRQMSDESPVNLQTHDPTAAIAMELLKQQLPREEGEAGGLFPVDCQNTLPPPVPFQTRPTMQAESVEDCPKSPMSIRFGRSARSLFAGPQFTTFRKVAVEDDEEEQGDRKMGGL
ncbi:hypothetical protein ACHAPI_011824 [Fusarium lateritium]